MAGCRRAGAQQQQPRPLVFVVGLWQMAALRWSLLLVWLAGGMAATPGGVCWNAMQAACPFEAGAECATCLGDAAPALARAGCSAVSLTTYCSSTPLGFHHRVVKLSSPRRNVGAIGVGDRAVFAGGCNISGSGGNTQFICDSADPAVDIFDEQGELRRTVFLSEPRGWICAATAGEHSVVLAGGGTFGDKPHSRRADVLDLETGDVQSYPDALTVGRWGIGCATVGNRSYFTGGKVTISGYNNAWMTEIVDTFELDDSSSTNGSWAMAPYNLSTPRESTTAVAVSGALIVAGGWKKENGKYQGDDTVDVFSDPQTGTTSETYTLKNDAYAVGAATVNSTAFVVGNAQLYRFGERAEAATPIPLPPVMVGVYDGGADSGGIVPDAHVQQNGVAVGKWACFWVRDTDAHSRLPTHRDGHTGVFLTRRRAHAGPHMLFLHYSLACRWPQGEASRPTDHAARASDNTSATSFALLSPALYCLDTATLRWARLACPNAHKGGAIAVAGATIMVAGGFDPADKGTSATDAVDLFTLDL